MQSVHIALKDGFEELHGISRCDIKEDCLVVTTTTEGDEEGTVDVIVYPLREVVRFEVRNCIVS